MNTITGALLRVSTDQQDTEGQISDLNAFATENGIKIDRWFQDKLSRDNAANRQEFQEILSLVKQGRLKLLLVQKLDRFGISDSDEWGYYRWIFRQHGCRILSAAEGDLTANDLSIKITTGLKADASAEEQRNISHRSLTGRALKAKDGECAGGPAPFGFDKVCVDASGKEVWRLIKVTSDHHIQILAGGKRISLHGKRNTPRKAYKTERIFFAPNEEQAKIVKLIFDLWCSNRIARLAIATRLNRQGHRKHGMPFSQASVTKILMNRKYVGDSVWNERPMGRFKEFRDGKAELISDEMRRTKLRGTKKQYIPRGRNPESQWIVKEGAYTPIITRRQFDLAQKKLREVEGGKTRTPRNYLFWLKDLIICAGCGKPMRGEVHKNVAAYFCSTWLNAAKQGRGDQCCCRRNTIPALEIEQRLFKWQENQKEALAQITDNHDVCTVEQVLLGEIQSIATELQNLFNVARGWDRYFDRLSEDFGLSEPTTPELQEMAGMVECLRRQGINWKTFLALDVLKCEHAKVVEAQLKKDLANIVRRKAICRSELEEEIWIEDQEKTEARIHRIREWAIPYLQRFKDACETAVTLRSPERELRTLAAQERAEEVRRVVKRIVVTVEATPNLSSLIHQVLRELGTDTTTKDVRRRLLEMGHDIKARTISTVRTRKLSGKRLSYRITDVRFESIFSQETPQDITFTESRQLNPARTR